VRRAQRTRRAGRLSFSGSSARWVRERNSMVVGLQRERGPSLALRLGMRGEAVQGGTASPAWCGTGCHMNVRDFAACLRHRGACPRGTHDYSQKEEPSGKMGSPRGLSPWDDDSASVQSWSHGDKPCGDPKGWLAFCRFLAISQSFHGGRPRGEPCRWIAHVHLV
jgi:hypothetical protein